MVLFPNGNAGSICTFTVGSLAAGNSGSVVFAVTVDDPLPAGVMEIENGACTADDGNNGPDPTPEDNCDDDDTPVDAEPDLMILKDDGGVSTEPGGVVVYTLDYANVGDQDATGVTISDTVPTYTSFNPGASTTGWSCLPSIQAGSICTLDVGDLAAGASGSVELCRNDRRSAARWHHGGIQQAPVSPMTATMALIPHPTITAMRTTHQLSSEWFLYLPMILVPPPPPTPTPTPTFTPTLTPTPTPTYTPTPPPTIGVIPHPKGIGIDEANNRLYIASKTTNLLFEVNGFTNTIIRQISVGAEPFGVVYNKVNHKVYVANFASGTVSVVDPVSMTVIKTINTGSGSEPTQVAVNTMTNRIYVTLHGTSELAVIDAGNDNVIANVPDLAGAFDVVVDEFLNQVFVSTRNGGYVATIDGGNNVKIRQYHVGGFPYSMAIDQDRRRLYVVYAPRTGMQDDTAIDGQQALPLMDNEPQAEEPNQVIVFEIKANDLGRMATLTAGPLVSRAGLALM